MFAALFKRYESPTAVVIYTAVALLITLLVLRGSHGGEAR
jgi:hypothetical protein